MNGWSVTVGLKARSSDTRKSTGSASLPPLGVVIARFVMHEDGSHDGGEIAARAAAVVVEDRRDVGHVARESGSTSRAARSADG